jgi:hypothetical protein
MPDKGFGTSLELSCIPSVNHHLKSIDSHRPIKLVVFRVSIALPFRCPGGMLLIKVQLSPTKYSESMGCSFFCFFVIPSRATSRTGRLPATNWVTTQRRKHQGPLPSTFEQPNVVAFAIKPSLRTLRDDASRIRDCQAEKDSFTRLWEG